ncbi:MAG: aspartate aminotransferase family protein [Bacteroidetes bacterium]|nr:MAG: aspartate aminotransferase family protein [Bacteroidota bacterium]
MLTNRQLFIRHLGQTSPAPMMVEIVRAEGVFMYGPDGKKYFDLISGVSVSNTGHSHPRVVEAVKNQVDSYMHLMVYGEIIQSPQVKYAERLSGILPPELQTCYFVNSGSEAVEGGLKLAKRYTGRSRIVYFKNSYHGSTHGALSVQGSELFRNAYRPMLPDTFQIDFNDEKSLDTIDNKTACVIIEPVQGEAGVIDPVNGFLEKIRSRCNLTGALLIFDEIQTGFGRTGYMFAIDRFGVVPDILLLAKALGGGMPLGAFISSNTIMSALVSDPPLGHITTFGGHPVCCAAGLASLNVIIEEKLVESCISKSDLFKSELVHPLISEIRGEGLLLAVQLTHPEYINYVITHSPDYGLILDYFLFCNNAFRIAPPLIIRKDEIITACTQLKKLLDAAKTNVRLK